MRPRKKTPLQEWAWNRYRLKGSVSGMVNMLGQLAKMKDLTPTEKQDLLYAQDYLMMILGLWHKSHQITRNRRVKKNEPKTTE